MFNVYCIFNIKVNRWILVEILFYVSTCLQSFQSVNQSYYNPYASDALSLQSKAIKIPFYKTKFAALLFS